MAVASFEDHKINVEGDDNPTTENTITCSCGYATTALPQFVLPLMERHTVLFIANSAFSPLLERNYDESD